MSKTRVEIISGLYPGQKGYIDYYHWEAGACFCYVVLVNEIVCVYLSDVKPLNIVEHY